MCDIDGGADIDFGADSDLGDSPEDSFDVMDDVGASDLESISDIDGDSFDTEIVESIQDMEESFEDDNIEMAEEYSALSEYDDLVDQTDDIEELENIRDQLDSEEIQEETMDVTDASTLSELDDVEPELTFSQEELQELYEENANNPEFGDKMDELISSGRVSISELVHIDESDEEGGRILTRENTPEILESRERDTEEVLDNYRENLQDRGVSEEYIEEFIEQERERINAEYESLDAGKPSENIYQMPTDWDVVAEGLENSTSDFSVEGDEGIKSVQESDEITESSLVNDEELEETSNDMPVDEMIQEMSENSLLSEVEDGTTEVSETNEEEESILPEIEEIDSNVEELSTESNGENISDEGVIEEVADDETDITVDENINTPSTVNDEPDETLAAEENLDEADNNIEEIDAITDEEQDESNEGIDEVQELEINYDEIYEGISQESLEQGFEDVYIYENPERLDASLENFETDNWEGMSIDDQKQSMNDLAEYVKGVIGFENPPRIEYYNNPREGDYGGYNSRTNTLNINEFMLYNNSEAADTVAHELWHAHQHECADHPSSARDYQYQYNFENYIRPEMGHEAYENQLIEAEARAFAAQFKGRLAELGSRRR